MPGTASTFATRTRCEVAVAQVDAVVHTAYRQGGEDEWTTNVDGSAAVAAAAAAVPRLVHISSDLVFDGSARPLRRGRTSRRR